MRVLITGGAGFLGQKLAKRLAADGTLAGKPLNELVLADNREPVAPEGHGAVVSRAVDVTDAAQVEELFSSPFDAVYHLAAVVSGQAEADFDIGMKVNLHGTLNVFEAARMHCDRPLVIYSSSVAVHGGEEPDEVPDGVELNPQTSYGTQKAMGELLLNDMTRKGYMDGRGLRLPTVSIRPGRANAAASGFMSSIFREPLQGQRANCPVGKDYAVWHSAPRTVIDNLVLAAEIDGEAFGFNRCVNLPGRTDTIGEMIEAMTRVAGPEPAGRISWDKDPEVERIVTGWRMRFRPEKALKLGFKADRSFEDNVRWFLEDDVERG